VARSTLPGGVQLIIDEAPSVAEVRLARPEVRNAQTMATWASLERAAAIIGERAEISLVLIRGAGDDFSAGLDLRMLRGSAPPGEGDLGELLTRDDTAVREAIAADLRVLSDDAVLVMAEARLGLVPDLGGTRRLVEIVGYPQALEICATAMPIAASRAQQLGLANAVIDRADFDAGLERYLARLLAVDSVVSRSVKSVIASAAVASSAEQLGAERQAQVPLLRRLGGR
jgi:enoyl-CoA hydratase/carnithine racemase